MCWHIQHKYSEEMSKESTIIPLGVIDKNETYTKEMIEILKELHKYVPTITEEVEVELGSEHMMVKEVNVHPILFGGDQLTTARARAAQLSMAGEKTAADRLEGLVPVIEDWHTKQALLVVRYSFSSQ